MFDALSRRGVRSSIATLLFLLSATLLLISCGGSDETPADQNPVGLFTGTATVDGGTSVTDLKAISHDNRLMIFSMEQHLLFDAVITDVTENTYTANVDVYENGVRTQSVTLSGGVTTGSSLSGTFSGGSGKADGSFAMTFSSLYNRDATEARINSTGVNPNWAGPVSILLSGHETNNFEKHDGTTNNFNFLSSVIVNNNIDSQCGYSGSISIPDSTKNVYDVIQERSTITDTSCTVSTSPTYTGMATVVDGTNVDDTLWYAVANGTHSVVAVLNH